MKEFFSNSIRSFIVNLIRTNVTSKFKLIGPSWVAGPQEKSNSLFVALDLAIRVGFIVCSLHIDRGRHLKIHGGQLNFFNRIFIDFRNWLCLNQASFLPVV